MRRNGSVLVVDDEEIMREILEALLTREGYRVQVASSGEEGLEYARTSPRQVAVTKVSSTIAGDDQEWKPTSSCQSIDPSVASTAISEPWWVLT